MSIRPSAFSFAAIVFSALFLGCGGTSSKVATAKVPPAITAASALADSARALAGTWGCSGSVYGPDGVASPSEVTVDVRSDLDEAWLQIELAVVSGAHKYKFKSHRTFDASSSKWVNVIVDNLGGHAVSSSADGVW